MHDKGRGELMKSTRLLRLEEVKRRTGFQKSSIYNRIAEGIFPRPVPLGARAVAWIEDEIQEWIDSRISERDKQR
jgi:prophage regulatory protein